MLNRGDKVTVTDRSNAHYGLAGIVADPCATAGAVRVHLGSSLGWETVDFRPEQVAAR